MSAVEMQSGLSLVRYHYCSTLLVSPAYVCRVCFHCNFNLHPHAATNYNTIVKCLTVRSNANFNHIIVVTASFAAGHGYRSYEQYF